MVDLEALEALLAKITPGPWQVIESRHPFRTLAGDGREVKGEHVARRIFTEWYHSQAQGPLSVANVAIGIGNDDVKTTTFIHIKEHDAALIAAAPTAIAELIAEIRRLRAIEARVEGAPVGHIIDLADEIRELERSGRLVRLVVESGEAGK